MSCKFNKCVLCENHTECGKCGWSPEVFEERKRKQREKIAIARLEEKQRKERAKGTPKWRFISL